MTPSPLLQLIWLASPALPIGGFSYSEGLEAAIEQGLVHHEASTTAFMGRLTCDDAFMDRHASLAMTDSSWRGAQRRGHP